MPYTICQSIRPHFRQMCAHALGTIQNSKPKINKNNTKIGNWWFRNCFLGEYWLDLTVYCEFSRILTQQGMFACKQMRLKVFFCRWWRCRRLPNNEKSSEFWILWIKNATRWQCHHMLNAIRHQLLAQTSLALSLTFLHSNFTIPNRLESIILKCIRSNFSKFHFVIQCQKTKFNLFRVYFLFRTA